jgi:hypothetical protein
MGALFLRRDRAGSPERFNFYRSRYISRCVWTSSSRPAGTGLLRSHDARSRVAQTPDIAATDFPNPL